MLIKLNYFLLNCISCVLELELKPKLDFTLKLGAELV